MPTAGWYPDPQDPSVVRYYDGQIWTEHTRPGTPAQPFPPAQPTQPAPPAWSPQSQQSGPGDNAPTQHFATPAAQLGWSPPAPQPWQPVGAPPWQQPSPGSPYPQPYVGGAARRRRGPLILALVVVLVAGLLAGGYVVFFRGDKAPTLTYAGSKIKNAAGVLKASETNVAAIVSRRHGAKSPDTRCYFAVPDKPASGAKKTDIDSNVRCGPVLFVDGDPAKQFLAFPLTKSGSGSTVTLVAATTPRSADPDSPPPAMKLKRPDGKTPPSGGGHLTVPNPPAAARDALLATDLGSAAAPKQLDGVEMISLNTGVRLSSAGIVARYGKGDDARSAPPGAQLVAFRIADVPGEQEARPTSGHLTVQVGSTVRPVPSADSSDSYVVVAVPSGAGAKLVLLDAGYSQSLSLPAGAAGAKNLLVLNRKHRSETLTKQAAVPIAISNGTASARVTFQATARFASLDFWVPSHEGAHPVRTDHAMLSVRLTYTDSQEPGKTFGFDPELLKLRLPGGRTVSARNVAPAGKVYNVFDVPASFTTGTVLITGSERSGGITLTVATTASFPISIAAG